MALKTNVKSNFTDPVRCNSEICLKGVKRVTFLKVPCEDFLLMGLKYQHMTPPSPDIDYIAIRLDLKDTRSGNLYQAMGHDSVYNCFGAEM